MKPVAVDGRGEPGFVGPDKGDHGRARRPRGPVRDGRPAGLRRWKLGGVRTGPPIDSGRLTNVMITALAVKMLCSAGTWS